MLRFLHPSNIYLRFTLYFVSFSFIVALLTSLVNYNNEYLNLDKDVYDQAYTSYQQKRLTVQSAVVGVEDDIQAVIDNPIFKTFIDDSQADSLQNANHLLLSLADANVHYFQVRYLDASGMERIRIEKPRGSKASIIVDKEKLQNKFERYYFTEVKTLSPNQFWHSKLDLNIEHGKIEQPIRPTLRVASPVFDHGEFAGMVIINADMSKVLRELQQSFEFDVYLIDGEGYFILHPEKSSQWSRYLNGSYRLQDVLSQAERLLQGAEYRDGVWYAFSFENDIKNSERIRLVLRVKEDYVRGLTMENVWISFYLALLILVISIPTGLLLAVQPSRLQKKLDSALKRNKKALAVIDEYVLTSETDLQGSFVKASSALCRLSGYQQQELIGRKHSIFKSGDMDDEFYKNLWNRISSGGVWSGEVKNRTKSGQSFWLDMSIIPRYEKGEMVGYVSVAHDITDQKMIEQISEQDPLTQLFNRVKLDHVLEQEALRVKRFHDDFSIILIDVDHFKLVNDRFGHPAGDSVLIELSQLLKEHTRAIDVVGRWGGEEFMVLCLETGCKGAEILAEKLRSSIEGHKFKYVDQQTASFGVSEFKINDTVSQCIKRADDALYKAKEQGRNRVEVGL